jgi:hypothetical protein
MESASESVFAVNQRLNEQLLKGRFSFIVNMGFGARIKCILRNGNSKNIEYDTT